MKYVARTTAIGLLFFTAFAAIAAPPNFGSRQYNLVGTVVSSDGSMAIIEDTDGSQFVVFPGEKLAGCRLKKVLEDRQPRRPEI